MGRVCGWRSRASKHGEAQLTVQSRSSFGHAEPVAGESRCPCCDQPVQVPTLEQVAETCQLTPSERSILGAVWEGRGMPVMTAEIFDAIYLDDPDGGPSQKKMYANFKWALRELQQKIGPTGISVVKAGSKRGYRLAIG